MIKVVEITNFIESIAPLSLQESYDNAGLITGNPEMPVKGVLICLDSTEAVVEEAIRKDCNLVLAHHPIIFRGLKKISGSTYVERAIIKAIKHDVAIYAVHTNLDNVIKGVNRKLCERIGLQNLSILKPLPGNLVKLITFIPKDHTMKVLDEIHSAGAGNIGNYDHCSFRVSGTGRFFPDESANPHLGRQNKMEEVEEDRIEVILPKHKVTDVLHALKGSHPYEEVAYYLQSLINVDMENGAGMIGDLTKPMIPEEFLALLKIRCNLSFIKYVPTEKEKISKVAVCGGSGSFLIQDALRSGADAFVSSDFKYHDLFDSEGKMLIADIGHYESEVFTKELIFELLNNKFSNIALRLSEVNTNPVRYI